MSYLDTEKDVYVVYSGREVGYLAKNSSTSYSWARTPVNCYWFMSEESAADFAVEILSDDDRCMVEIRKVRFAYSIDSATVLFE